MGTKCEKDANAKPKGTKPLRMRAQIQGSKATGNANAKPKAQES